MSVAALSPLARKPGPSPLEQCATERRLYRLSSDQYQRMIELGILAEQDRCELIRGLILEKVDETQGDDGMGHKPPHALVIALLSALIVRINNAARHLRIQLPIILEPQDVPEPDGSIVRGTPRDYANRLPGAQDTSCVIEVADRSLDRDRSEKLPACAAGSIPQFVLINLRAGMIEVYADPDPSQKVYATKTTVTKGQTLSLNLGDGEFLEVLAEDLLP